MNANLHVCSGPMLQVNGLILNSVADLLLHEVVVGQKAFQSSFGEILYGRHKCRAVPAA